jgi:hypothetical protein
MPSNVSYVFSLNPARITRYTVPTNDFEVKAISARNMEVSVVDGRGVVPIEAFIMRNDVLLAVSVIVGANFSLQFYKSRGGSQTGYIGAVA